MQKFWKTHLPSLEPSRGPGKLRKNQSQKSRHLSFDPEASGLTGIPLLFLKDVYAQASNLLASAVNIPSISC